MYKVDIQIFIYFVIIKRIKFIFSCILYLTGPLAYIKITGVEGKLLSSITNILY